MKRILLFSSAILLPLSSAYASAECKCVVEQPPKRWWLFQWLVDLNNFDTAIQVLILLVTAWSLYITYKISRSALFQSRIDSEGQINILSDITRHIYRNKVVIISMIAMYKQHTARQSGAGFYPAEDHYHKLSLLDEDLYVHQHSRDDTFYRRMHQIYLNIRNLNHEIGAAIAHTKEPSHNIHTIRDLQNIDFKLTLINRMVIDLIVDRCIAKQKQDMCWVKKAAQWVRNKICNYNETAEKEELRRSAIEEFVTYKIKESQEGTAKSNPQEELHGTDYKEEIVETMAELFSDENKYCLDDRINTLCLASCPCEIRECYERCPIYKDCLIECGTSITGYSKILIIRK